MKFDKTADRLVEEIKIEQLNMQTASDRINAHLGQLHNIADAAIEKYAKRFLPDGTKGLHFLSVCEAGCKSNNWKGAQYFISEYNGENLYPKHRFYNRINKLCKKLTEETAISFYIYQNKY